MSSPVHGQLNIIWERSGEIALIGELDDELGLDVLALNDRGEFELWDWATGEDKYTIDNLPGWIGPGYDYEFYLVDLFGDGRGEILMLQRDPDLIGRNNAMGLVQLVTRDFHEIWHVDFVPDSFELAPVLEDSGDKFEANSLAILCLFGDSGEARNLKILDLSDGSDLFDFARDAYPNQRITEIEILDVIRSGPLEIVVHYYNPFVGRTAPEMPQNTLLLGIDPMVRIETEEPAAKPVGTSIFLSPSTPNPSTGTTMIQFNVPEAGDVDLRIYDAAGRLVRILVNRPMLPGRHDAVWDGLDDQGSPVGSGVYFYELRTNWEKRTRKLIRLK